MGSASTWWQGQSGPSRFRLWTRVTLQVSGLVVVAVLLTQSPSVWSVPGIVLAALGASVLVELQPGLTSWPGRAWRRRAVPATIALLAATWLGYGLLARLAERESLVLGARHTGVVIVLAIAISVLPFVEHRWWWAVALGVGSGLLYGETWRGSLVLAAVLLGFCAFSLSSMIVTLYGLRLMDDLDRARTLEARLQVADERLRFSRDLHDVVGRGFSAVAVKSELAATLARCGEAERAAVEMDEVKALAVESMGQMRQLVRGYRDIDLANEVAGARALLAAVGCRLDVQGDPDRLPERFHELAAWATREGTTNIVKHSAASVATLAFGAAGMSLRNDGVRGEMDERSGLQGLAERAAAAGASLTVSATEEEFVLEIVWQAS